MKKNSVRSARNRLLINVRILPFLMLMGIVFGACTNEKIRSVAIIIDQEDNIATAKSAEWARDQFKRALQSHGIETKEYGQLSEVPEGERKVMIAGIENEQAVMLLDSKGNSFPDFPESSGLIEGQLDGQEVLLACGNDARGLGYALLELADRMNCGIPPDEALQVPDPIIEQPAVKVRSIYRTFTSDIEDKGWYNDREFWKNYFTELATQRINRFSLSFGMGYNLPRGVADSYFFFAYPFLVDVPGYDVYAENLPESERDTNLEMLKFISDQAVLHGLDFQLALWSHGKDWTNSEDVNYPIIGLTDDNHAPYCRDALKMILESCPSISGITFRVHYESGIPRGEQGFWDVLFDAFPDIGRPVWIDMHGKQVLQEQIEAAVATGMPVSISPKYWGEHQGLAYHQADIRRREKARLELDEPEYGVIRESRKFTRYGYGDLLPEDRNWEVLHRIWPGTQRLLLSGDPVLAAGYGRISDFCGSLGVERLDPLAFKGRRGTGYPGGRCAYLDKSLEPTWDFQKYLYTYRIWGRLVYNPDTDPEVWRRYLRKQFQEAAEPVEIALASSSRVLKLITTAHGPSADCKVYWPEIYNNQPIVTIEGNPGPDYRDTDKPAVFGNVSPFDPQLFSKMNEYAAALMKDTVLAKYSPLEVARWLDQLADAGMQNLDEARSLVNDRNGAAFRRMEADVKIQCGIARFFADKMRSAVLWHLYEESGDTIALKKAIEKYTCARNAWAEMAEEAKSIYVPDISFGELWQLRGHWANRIPSMDFDIANMKDVLEKAIEADAGNNNRSVENKSIKAAIETVESPPQRTTIDCKHQASELFKPGEAMQIKLTAADKNIRNIYLFYRHVNQAVDWRRTTMKQNGDQFQSVIPAEYTDTRYPMSYYFAVDLGDAGIAIYPGLDQNLAGMPYYVVRQKR